MRSTLDEFCSEIGDVKALISSIPPVNEALAENSNSAVRQYLTIRKRFDYAAFVVALYASFEKFTENIVIAYAKNIIAYTNYKDLPSALVKKHLAKTADMLARGRLGEGRYVGVREIDLVKNLFDCLSGASPYILNDHAIVAHDLNLRYTEVNNLFSAVGIEKICDRTRKTDELIRWFCAANNLETPPTDGVPTSTIEQRLDDIVERRNQVAHRGGSPLDILGQAEMEETAGFIEALTRSMFSNIVAVHLRERYVNKQIATELQFVEGPYKENFVIIVHNPCIRLYLGQPIFGLNHGVGAKWGRILEIQINDESAEYIEANSGNDKIGLRVDFKCSENYLYYAMAIENEEIWTQYIPI